LKLPLPFKEMMSIIWREREENPLTSLAERKKIRPLSPHTREDSGTKDKTPKDQILVQ